MLIDGEWHLTAAEFDLLCRRAAAWLTLQGVGRGDVVAVWLVNRVEWLALLFALARLGAVLVTVNTRYRSDEVAYILRKSGARLLVTQAVFRAVDFLCILQQVGAAADGLPLEAVAVLGMGNAAPSQVLGRPVRSVDFPSAPPTLEADQSDPDATVILFPTSGTTDGPKLVMHPQRTLADHAWRCAAVHGLDKPGAALLAGLPLCGAFGLNSLLAALAGGAPSVLMDAFDGERAAALMHRHGVTHTYGSDEMFIRLLSAQPGDRPFPAARVFGFGAFTTSFGDEARGAWERGVPLHGLYGSSEVLALFAIQPRVLPVGQRIEGGGSPVAGANAALRIRDTASGEFAPPGVSGEIEIRAPSLASGYYNDPATTAKVFLPDGYFRTGDLGHVRPDGTLVYESRMGDAMRLGGFLVAPAEIEAILKRLPDIEDAQVVAVPVDGRPQAVAFVVPARGASPDAAALAGAVRAEAAAFKVPARIWFVDGFPIADGTNGLKVQRNKLRDMALERLAAEPLAAS